MGERGLDVAGLCPANEDGLAGADHARLLDPGDQAAFAEGLFGERGGDALPIGALLLDAPARRRAGQVLPHQPRRFLRNRIPLGKGHFHVTSFHQRISF